MCVCGWVGGASCVRCSAGAAVVSRQRWGEYHQESVAMSCTSLNQFPYSDTVVSYAPHGRTEHSSTAGPRACASSRSHQPSFGGLCSRDSRCGGCRSCQSCRTRCCWSCNTASGRCHDHHAACTGCRSSHAACGGYRSCHAACGGYSSCHAACGGYRSRHAACGGYRSRHAACGGYRSRHAACGGYRSQHASYAS